ncbi:MAG: Rid family hydrolase [Sedimentisphaerales bacterium]
MTVKLDTRSIESASATEIYISAVPGESASGRKQAQEIFSGISDILRSKKAYILQERVFAAQSAMEILSRERSRAYGDLDDGVAPSFLLAKEGLLGPVAGAQVHAISTNIQPEVVKLNGKLCGRILRTPAAPTRVGRRGGRSGRDPALRESCTYLTLSNISAATLRSSSLRSTNPQYSEATEQAQAMMKTAESVLKQFGADFLSVPRTWMWLKDILSWYDDFNHIRTEFFTERRLIGEGTRQSMPASTGIGLGPADGSHCAMDLTAVLEPQNSIKFLQAVGKQQCALEYGSAFSRASRAITPAGQTVFVSGTASIDADGATTHIGDASGQISTTIGNVRAVLSDMNCRDEDVVQMVAYCKTTEVEKIFNDSKGTLNWPWLTAICDICRPDLLFEIEATAMPR